MLFDRIVYGPIHSRRLGVSLGVNLMPIDAKLCTFNCIYCECGWNKEVLHPTLPKRQEVSEALERQLSVMKADKAELDVITFSGNGEPTLHPDFENIIADTCMLRDKYFPDAKVSVLSNSTQLQRKDVVRGLKMADNRILKLDSAIEQTMHLIDNPVNKTLTVEQIKQMLQQFEHQFTLQTCFLKGTYNGVKIDNTTEEELKAYYSFVGEVAPKNIMIYVIDRTTPCSTLEKIPQDKMQQIAMRLRKMGFEVSVSA